MLVLNKNELKIIVSGIFSYVGEITESGPRTQPRTEIVYRYSPLLMGYMWFMRTVIMI